MRFRFPYYFLLPGILLMILPGRDLNAQHYKTWLNLDSGYLHQKIEPMHLRVPVYQTDQGFSSSLSLYYADPGSYHQVTVAYYRQDSPNIHPSDIPSFIDRYLSLAIDYEYTYFLFENIADLNLDFGTGPYLFVQNQIADLEGSGITETEFNSLLYGGGVNLVLRYVQPGFPLDIRLNFVNGGYWGNEDLQQQDLNFATNDAKGWLSEANMLVSYRIETKWKVYLLYSWTERLEYLELQNQRRTFQNISLGVSFRLEDD